MSAYTGTRRSEDVIGAVDERSPLQWARRKIEEVKAGLRGDPGPRAQPKMIPTAIGNSIASNPCCGSRTHASK